jgi:outer membrane receptor for ferrienterochelin and colicin
LVKQLSDKDVLRLATGATTIQPYATYIDLPFSPVAAGALNGVLNCTGLTPIGQVSNPNIGPEHANDQELSYGHSFESGSQFQLTLYNENVNDKIYATIIPVSTLPAGVIDPTLLQSYETFINSHCGTTGLSGVGVNSQNNIGRLLARGIDLNGRLRTTSKLFFDYDYSVESSSLKSADVTTLQNNLFVIPGSQLPGVPLHKGSFAADVAIGRNIDARLEQTWIAANNSKNSGAYNYGDFTLNIPVHNDRDSLALAVNNVFNQYTGFTGLIGHGYPLPLNQYATSGQYAPLIGAGATELFGLPCRQLFVSYTFHLR